MEERRMLYVGGLNEAIKDADITAAFNTFGEIVKVNIPLDKDKNPRGFAFVEFEDPEDAAAAFENMNNSELLGSVLNVNYAKDIQLDMKEAIGKSRIEIGTGDVYEVMSMDDNQFFQDRKRQKPNPQQ